MTAGLVVADNALIKVVPGLMIWTIVSFAITLFVLWLFAFGPIQAHINLRRERLDLEIRIDADGIALCHAARRGVLRVDVEDGGALAQFAEGRRDRLLRRR